jgi:hypothetical protein
VVIAVAIYYFFFRKKSVVKESSFNYTPTPNNLPPLSPEESRSQVESGVEIPEYFQLQYKISTQGKKSVFPMVLEKVTDEAIELPNRRSLISRDVKYKFIDVMPGDTIKAVSLQRLNYVIDDQAISDDFLVTDKDYVIAYSQARKNFKIVG